MIPYAFVQQKVKERLKLMMCELLLIEHYHLFLIIEFVFYA